jgi:hypothetical protein
MPFFLSPSSTRAAAASRAPRRLARQAGLLALAVAVAGSSFGLVLRFQSSGPPAGPAGRVDVLAPVGPDPQLIRGIGAAPMPWLLQYQNGQVVSQFNATRLVPQTDGTIDVTRPVSVFYLSNGRYMLVTGDTGVVAFDNAAPGGGGGGGLAPGGMGMPDRGRLHDVHIALYPSIDADRPTLTMETDNVRFDNQTLRLYTEKFTDADGHVVPADRVPVTVRGADYDMDGTGLTLRMSEGANGDRQLHLLEIAHGKRLTIRHPNAMHATTAPAPAVASPAAATVAASATQAPPVVPAAPPANAGPAPAHVPSPATKPAPIPYRAVFNDDVQIKQGDPATAAANGGRPDATLALGDVLSLDFLQDQSVVDAGPAATTPAPARVAPPRPPTAPFAPSADVAPVPAQAAARTSAGQSLPPTSQPVVPEVAKPGKLTDGPITVYWTGKLRVTPLAPTAATMLPLEQKQSVARLVGRPAKLTANGATAKAAVATYRTVDNALRLEPSDAVPTVFASQKGMTLVARSIAFDPATSVATIIGPATLDVTQESGRHLKVTWVDRGLLHVVPSDPAKTDLSGVDHVDLTGSVVAADPTSFNLIARRLLLDLDVLPPARKPTTTPAAGQPSSQEQLRRLTAVGGVVCRMFRPGQPDRGINGDRLVVGMAPDADGHPAPRTVVADGRVRLSDADQQLRANHVEAVLDSKPTPAIRPTTGPTTDPTASVSLASLLATGDVQAVLKNGSCAEGDVLREQTADDGRQMVELSGAGPVRVTTAKGERLVGSVLHVAADGPRDVVTVDGPGTLHSTPKPAASPTTAPARPMDVSWTDGMSYDAAANIVDVVGHVLARTMEAKGAVDTVVGDTAHLDLADPPKSTTRPADDDLGGKQLRTLTLTGHVHGTTDLQAGPILLRHGDLFGEKLVYDAVANVAHVPGPGKLLVENHRPPATEPAAATAASGQGPSRPGEMALKWRDGLTYDQPTDRVTIVGDTHAAFLPDAAKPGAPVGGPMQLRSDKLVIDLRQVVDAKPVPGKPTAAKADAGKQKSQVSKLRATGAVHFRARTIDVYCHAAEYDPDAGTLTAHGSPAEPGRAADLGKNGGAMDGGFDTLVFDTVREEIISVNGVRGTFRR